MIHTKVIVIFQQIQKSIHEKRHLGLTLVIVLKCIIDLCTLPCCDITFQSLSDSCLHQQKNKKVSNNTQSGPSARGKDMYVNRPHVPPMSLDSLPGMNRYVATGVHGAVCPRISSVQWWIPGWWESALFYQAHCITSSLLGPHLE